MNMSADFLIPGWMTRDIFKHFVSTNNVLLNLVNQGIYLNSNNDNFYLDLTITFFL